MGITRRHSLALLGAAWTGAALKVRRATAAPLNEAIIVSGASGQLGELVVQELLKRGVAPARLILVSRTPDKLAEYGKRGARVRFGDFSQPQSLPAAFAGGQRMLLISITPGKTPRPEQHKAAMDAAVQAGVQHIAYTSFVNLDHNPTSPLAADHRRSEAFLRASGAHWTMLRNGLYADMLLPQAHKILAAGRIEVPADDVKVAWVTRADCAAAAAGALTTTGHDDKAYDITGPDLIDQHDFAKLLMDVTGRTLQIVEVPARSGGPTMGGAALCVKTDAVLELAGRNPMSVRELLQAHRGELLTA